jgi:hypothetical protein
MALLQMPTQVIEIRHFQDGWKVHCESDEPYFVGPAAIEHAIAFARERAKSSPTVIRLMASDGKLISQIPGTSSPRPSGGGGRSAPGETGLAKDAKSEQA